MRIASTALLGFALVLAAGGQTPVPEITGVLHDRSGGSISGARVMLMNQDYVKLAETKSGEHGEFEFSGVQPGLYFVQAKKPYFRLAQQNVPLQQGQKRRVHLVADVASADDGFTIETDRPPDVEPAPAGPATPRAGGKTEACKLAKFRPPAFPESARRRGAHGAVVLLASIRVDGTLDRIITLESPDAELERAAIDSFSKWRYVPTMLNGEPVESSTIATFDFKYR